MASMRYDQAPRGGDSPDIEELLDIDELADLARAVLPGQVWDYVAGGSQTETSLAGNRSAFTPLRVLPRVLRDVSGVSAATTLFGSAAAVPVAVAPMAYQRLVHPDGELAAARAARAAGVPYTVATLSSTTVEEVAAAGGTLWFQLYWLRDRGVVAELLGRAEAAGCRALLLTVDVPKLGRRRRDVRNGFALPPEVVAAHLTDATVAHQRRDRGSALEDFVSSALDPSLSWPDLEWLRARTQLPLVLKGVLDPVDAAHAASTGVDGLVVSNHGGRQLDGAAAPIDVLPAVCEAFGERGPVLLDSGVRSGLDVLKAMALGASGVLLGRPVLWGLAVGGEAGVRRVLSLVGEELTDAMALAGCPDLASVRRLTVIGPGAQPAAQASHLGRPVDRPIGLMQ